MRLLKEPLDVMVVVGGYNSSNTISLAALCAEQVQTYHIEDADEPRRRARDTVRLPRRSGRTASWRPAATGCPRRAPCASGSPPARARRTTRSARRWRASSPRAASIRRRSSSHSAGRSALHTEPAMPARARGSGERSMVEFRARAPDTATSRCRHRARARTGAAAGVVGAGGPHQDARRPLRGRRLRDARSDLYHGESTTHRTRPASCSWRSTWARRPRSCAAAEYLTAIPQCTPKKVGALGFCMGGQLALLRRHRPSQTLIHAVVDFYGIFNPAVPIDVSQLRAPVQAHFGRHDALIPVEKARGTHGRDRRARRAVHALPV